MDGEFYVWITVLIILIALMIAMGVRQYNIKNGPKKEALKKQEAERKEKENKLEKIKTGSWVFPATEFYKECKKAGIRNLEEPFYRSKAKLIADGLLRKNEVPIEYHCLYNSEIQLKEYFRTEESTEKRQESLKQREEMESRQRPQRAELTEIEQRTLKFNQEQCRKKKLEKINYILSYQIDNLQNEIKDKQLELSKEQNSMIDASIKAQRKTTSWGLTGGIAEAIAGPAAGVVAASETIKKNEAIKAQNAEIRMNTAMILAAESKKSEKYISERKAIINKLEQEREANKRLVVLDNTSTEDIFSHLIMGHYTVRQTESKALQISSTVRCSYRPTVPDGIETVVDGGLSGKVYAGSMEVGTFYMPLPTKGVPCNFDKVVTAEALCEMYSKNGEPYRVEFTPINLWIMEKPI